MYCFFSNSLPLHHTKKTINTWHLDSHLDWHLPGALEGAML